RPSPGSIVRRGFALFLDLSGDIAGDVEALRATVHAPGDIAAGMLVGVDIAVPEDLSPGAFRLGLFNDAANHVLRLSVEYVKLGAHAIAAVGRHRCDSIVGDKASAGVGRTGGGRSFGHRPSLPSQAARAERGACASETMGSDQRRKHTRCGE